MNKKWTISEEKYLRDNVDKLTDVEISVELTRTSGREFTMLAVRKKRQKFGLKKARGRGYCKLEEPAKDFYAEVEPIIQTAIV